MSMHVLITREMFNDYFILTLDNGYTEELEVDDAKAWFKERGANVDVVEKALDHAWNFLRAEVNIAHPKEPTMPVSRFSPKI